VSKHKSKRKEKRKGRGGVYNQAIKGTAREEPSTSFLEKGTGIL